MTLVHKTRGDMSFVNFTHTVEISCKTIKTAKNTFSDICAENSRRNEFCDFLAHTVVISHKTVKSAKNTIYLIFVHRTHGEMSFVTFSLIQL